MPCRKSTATHVYNIDPSRVPLAAIPARSCVSIKRCLCSACDINMHVWCRTVPEPSLINRSMTASSFPHLVITVPGGMVERLHVATTAAGVVPRCIV